jgi:hypothetical protein
MVWSKGRVDTQVVSFTCLLRYQSAFVGFLA